MWWSSFEAPPSLDHEKVIAVCEDSFADFGLSVFAALDGDVEALCLSLERFRSPGTISVASCGRLRAAGFTLAATDAAPHFDVVLPSLDRKAEVVENDLESGSLLLRLLGDLVDEQADELTRLA